ncbi:hypothetical protein EYZ11_010064 [Aspergillus tanneri]|uniref:Uncharacterized protein n=1 Tax=Aspergillus tanneri TaxID=1220188 RepID=A0A4S3J6A7_9EURO|nr:uncharacterized protein ATNIH1004_002871 [Aspergillus tanneri]KAA8650190.1 hypothetical protein ATNIH1004_002871 [Aspergillus tanneri]THC90473.1 hypothetical protein EYZ11_010064 [Aspergillus tanneri]
MSEDTPTSTRPSSPDSNGSLFHHKSWLEPWTHPEFPPDESRRDREKRFKQKEWVGYTSMPQFLKQYTFRFRDQAWPWGYFIYRTTYASEEDWTAALAKLNRYFYHEVKPPNRELLPGQLDAYKLIYEGYRNVIIEDPELDGVGADIILKKHREWVTRHGLDTYASPRFGHCLMIDEQCLRSILASKEPGTAEPSGCDPWTGPHGYINILDVVDHDPEDPEYDEGPFYNGCMRLELDALFCFACNCEDYPLCDQYWYLNSPEWVLYTDGRSARGEPKDMVIHWRKRGMNIYGYEREPYP